VVVVVIASLVLVSGLALAASPGGPEVQPVPTPPAAAQAAVSAAGAVSATAVDSAAARPAPRPVPTPAEGRVLPNGQAGELPLLAVPGLLALAALGLVAVRWWACLPGASAGLGARPTLTPCQEGA
jgi:hypothetical protein